MVLSTTFALAQRHERREMNENNKMTSSRWDEFLSRLKARTIASRTLSLLIYPPCDTVNCQLSIVTCQLLTVNCQL